jgi:archaellum component FlaC
MYEKEDNFTSILKKLDEIIQRLDKIEDDIKYLKNGSDSMADHISFIEHVYDTIKSPFYFIMNKIKPIHQIPEKRKNLLVTSNAISSDDSSDDRPLI